jgi:hypothetical protein
MDIIANHYQQTTSDRLPIQAFYTDWNPKLSASASSVRRDPTSNHEGLTMETVRSWEAQEFVGGKANPRRHGHFSFRIRGAEEIWGNLRKPVV